MAADMALAMVATFVCGGFRVRPSKSASVQRHRAFVGKRFFVAPPWPKLTPWKTRWNCRNAPSLERGGDLCRVVILLGSRQWG
jgi:hypothetical protein